MSQVLTKLHLARQLAREKRFNLTVDRAADLIETMFDLIASHLAEEREGSVTVRGFGTFRLRHRRAFIGCHPRTGDGIRVKASVSLAFKPSPYLVKTLNQRRRILQ